MFGKCAQLRDAFHLENSLTFNRPKFHRDRIVPFLFEFNPSIDPKRRHRVSEINNPKLIKYSHYADLAAELLPNIVAQTSYEYSRHALKFYDLASLPELNNFRETFCGV